MTVQNKYAIMAAKLEASTGVKVKPYTISELFRKYNISDSDLVNIKGLKEWVKAYLTGNPHEFAKDLCLRVNTLESKVLSLEERIAYLESSMWESEAVRENKALKLQLKKFEDIDRQLLKDARKIYNKTTKELSRNPTNEYAEALRNTAQDAIKAIEDSSYENCYTEAVAECNMMNIKW